jgi:hypothetical protein
MHKLHWDEMKTPPPPKKKKNIYIHAQHTPAHACRVYNPDYATQHGTSQITGVPIHSCRTNSPLMLDRSPERWST